MRARPSASLQIREYDGIKQLLRPGYKKHWVSGNVKRILKQRDGRVLYSKELGTPASGCVLEPCWKGIPLPKSIKSSDDSKLSLLFYCSLMRDLEAEPPYK